MMSVLVMLLISFWFFEVNMIVFVARLLACIYYRGSFSFSEALFAFLPFQVLLNFWGGLFVFGLFSLEVLLLSDDLYLPGIYTPLNIDFSWMISSKILRSLIQMTLFWLLIWTL